VTISLEVVQRGSPGRKYKYKSGRRVRGVGGVRGEEFVFRSANESEEKIQIQVGEILNFLPQRRGDAEEFLPASLRLRG